MNIRLYNISAPPEKVTKVTSSTNYDVIENVVFFDANAIDVIHPVIKLKLNTELSQNIKYNYCYIAKLGRYYFIDTIKTDGGLVIMELSVDPLQSFKSDILGSTQYVIRSEKWPNRKIVDSLLPLHSDHNILIDTIGDDVFVRNCDHVILETIGKGGTVS